MIKYVERNCVMYKIDFFQALENGKITFSIEQPYYEIQTRKVYYRHEKTWDDHLGNTDCGYYVIAKLSGKNTRVYIY